MYKIVLDNYVDPIDPEALLVHMVSGIEKKVGHTGLLNKNKINILSLVDAGYAEATPTSILKFSSSLFSESKNEDISNAAVSGMISSLDPYCSLLPPEAFEELLIDTKGKFTGIGISITIRDDLVTVISPIVGTPAYKAGIRAGDRIVKVDNKSIKDLRKAVNLMRGPKGTKVNVTIARPGESEPIKHTLVRDVIPIISVKSTKIQPGYGYIWITHFRDNTIEDLKKALEKLENSKQKLQGLIIDLRDNPGGLLPQAIKVSDLFMEKGTILSIKGRLTKYNKMYRAKKSRFDRKYPVVVLINGGSASASEIVAGALQDNNRAVIIGTTSFGKGSVQTVEPLRNGYGLKLSVARYFTPLGHSIQAKSIKPHVVLNLKDLPDKGLKERDLLHHLNSKIQSPNDATNKKEPVKESQKAKRGTKKAKHKLGPLDSTRLKNDNQVQLALRSLKESKTANFEDLLLASKQVFTNKTNLLSSKENIKHKTIPSEEDRVFDDKRPPIINLSNQYRALMVVPSAQHIITGQAVDESGVAIVKINGKEAALDSKGNFYASILLKPGMNTVLITAVDVFENKASKFVTINRGNQGIPTKSKDTINTGKYYALLIASEDYISPSIRNLNQPVKDAMSLKLVLQETYTFDAENITVLENPVRADVINKLDELSTKVQSEDNLLIFFAGHGFWDEKFRQGYWLLADSKRNRRDAWLSNSTIRDYIRGINSKHTLLVSDACFSGGIFKTRSTFIGASAATKELYKRNSRKAMTSGTLKEVPDRSVFLEYMLKNLRENQDQYISSEQLFVRFKDAVINNSPTRQIPQFGEIREAGDEGGDFIFVRK